MAEDVDPKPRREIRIPVPDMAGIRASASELASKAAEKTKEINANPPKWLYWAMGIGIIVIFQLIRVAAHH